MICPAGLAPRLSYTKNLPRKESRSGAWSARSIRHAGWVSRSVSIAA